MRQYYSSDSPFEQIVGYSRAVKIDKFLEIAGTTSISEGQVIAPYSPYEQTMIILEKIQSILKEFDLGMENIIKTKMYVTEISRWKDYGRAHAEYFKNIKPASTMVEVSGLIRPELMIEIEGTAYFG